MIEIKVLQINCVYGVKSTGKIVAQIGDYLNSQNVESYVAYGFGEKIKDSHIFKVSNKFSLHYHGFLSRKLSLQGYFSKYTTYRLVRFIKKIKPDVIHLHNIHDNYINFKVLFSYLKKYNGKVVWTMHDCWAYTGGCMHYTEEGCYKWKDKCNSCTQLTKYHNGAVVDNTGICRRDKEKYFTCVKNLTVVAVSKWLENEIRKSFFKNCDICTISNGIDTDVFKFCENNIRQKLNIGNEFVVLGVASKLEKKKGLDDFIKLSEKLSQEAVLVLVGVSPDMTSQLPNNIKTISFVQNQNELAQIYSMADVFVSLSAEETFGLVVCEAMACGTPAIVYDSTALSELIDDSTGYVLEKNNIDGLVLAVNKIKKVGKMVYSKNCINKVQDYYSKEKMICNYFSLYNK